MVKRKSLIVYFRTPKAIKQIDKVLPVVYYNKKRRYAICYSNEEEISKKTEELKMIKLVKRIEESKFETEEYQLEFDVK